MRNTRIPRALAVVTVVGIVLVAAGLVASDHMFGSVPGECWY
jgi:hypothetical protein